MRRLLLALLTIAVCLFAADCARGDQLRLPDQAVAGQALTIGTSGSGEATLCLIGPAHIIKRTIHLGEEVEIKGDELQSAGRWIAVLRSGGNPQSHIFWVKAAQAAQLSFLARPSRVPVARPDAITGMAFVFDGFHNLILQPTPVNFSLSVGGAGVSRAVPSVEGIAWIRTSSARKAGAAQFVASVGNNSVRRVVEQVASDPCNLTMHIAQHSGNAVRVETSPIRDCTGNPVPDGTIVTFTETSQEGRSTVDARIKKGIAAADLPYSPDGSISVAAGVVLGNELRLGGRQ
ncbi:MAG TPA: hypothetical protein VKT33_15390 [Candidatus Angelobacter sp.]|nr:hypothetical protein [Candidatus Angelobacter sp.]